MPEPDTKRRPMITVCIVPSKGTPAMKSQWHKFFLRLIVECEEELLHEIEGKDECSGEDPCHQLSNGKDNGKAA